MEKCDILELKESILADNDARAVLSAVIITEETADLIRVFNVQIDVRVAAETVGTEIL